MATNEIQAAARDIARWMADEGVSTDENGLTDEVAVILKRHLCLADDDEAIDEAWLWSVGFVSYGRMTDLEIEMPKPVEGFRSFLRVADSYGEGPLHFDTALWTVWVYEHMGEGSHPEGATIGRALATTRGQLRRLCSALGITFKESP